MANIVVLYISQKKDSDLYALLNDVGRANFRLCCIYSLMSIFDKNYINKARDSARKKVENGFSTYESCMVNANNPEKSGVKIRLSITNSKYKLAREILKEVKPGYVSSFIKTTVRQVLGPQILMKYFLVDDSKVKIEDTPLFASLISISSLPGASSLVKQRKPYTRRKNPDKKKPLPKLPTEPLDIPSFSSAPSFESPKIQDQLELNNKGDFEKDIEEDAAATNSEDDLLSMLEAMMQ